MVMRYIAIFNTHNTIIVDSKYHHYPYVGSIFKVPTKVRYFLAKSQRKFMLIRDKPVCLKRSPDKILNINETYTQMQ